MSYVLISETKPIARKAHRCIWCGEGIRIGEQYVRERSVYDSDPQSHKWHFECLDAARTEWLEWGADGEFSPHENSRPPSAAEREYASWDCAALLQAKSSATQRTCPNDHASAITRADPG